MKENNSTLAKVEDKINNVRHNLNEGEIVLYQPDESINLEVRLDQETVWLTQMQMVELFKTTKQNISLHIGNIFKEGELDRRVAVKNPLTTTQHGAIPGKFQHSKVLLYNLDVIISVGYRVKNPIGTRFRQWATTVLREHLLKGYTINHHLVALQQNVDSRFESLENRVGVQEQQIAFLVNMHQQPSGASVKDMGKGLCTVIELGFSPEEVLGKAEC